MEYCEGRDLHSVLNLRAAGTGERVFGWRRRGRRVLCEVARAVSYLHAHNVVHLDIKSSNVLLSATGTAGEVGGGCWRDGQGGPAGCSPLLHPVLALCGRHCQAGRRGPVAARNQDLAVRCGCGHVCCEWRCLAHGRQLDGLGRIAGRLGTVRLQHRLSSPSFQPAYPLLPAQWAAPEVLLGSGCTNAVDLYSLGVLMWEASYTFEQGRQQVACTGQMEQCGAYYCIIMKYHASPSFRWLAAEGLKLCTHSHASWAAAMPVRRRHPCPPAAVVLLRPSPTVAARPVCLPSPTGHHW